METALVQTTTGSKKMNVTHLQSDLVSTGINARTGRSMEVGTLPSGCHLKDARQIGSQVKFQASTDNGDSWFYEVADAAEFKAAAPGTKITVVAF